MLDRDYSLEEVAKALGMSTRWVRNQIATGNVEHIRYGHKIRFTSEQVEALRAANVRRPIEQSITTGRKKKSA